MYHGDYALESTFDIKFTTRRFATGAPFALASGVISAYPGNSTTQLTAGITLTADFDTVTGLNNVRVVATAANGYAAATNYALVITTGTVDSVSVVGEVIGHFSLDNRSALRPTTAGRTLDVTATGAAGIDWGNVENPTTALNLSATNIDVDQVVASVSGTVATVTTLTNLPAITANWLTAAGLATDAAQEIADTIRGRQLTESYAADGVAPTVEQALFLIQQMLTEMSIAGTTMTVKKLDGATTAATLTLNDATTPTSITRTT